MRKTNPFNVRQIKKVAEDVRKSYNISSDTFFPIYNYIQELYYQGAFDYQILDDNDPLFEEGVKAFYSSIDNTIYVKDSVDEEASSGEVLGYRSNFTLAHELFHYIQVNLLHFEFSDVVEKVQSYMDPEWQANEFAGQLLLPEEYIDLEDSELQQKYHVSLECISTRKLYVEKRKNYNKVKK